MSARNIGIAVAALAVVAVGLGAAYFVKKGGLGAAEAPDDAAPAVASAGAGDPVGAADAPDATRQAAEEGAPVGADAYAPAEDLAPAELVDTGAESVESDAVVAPEDVFEWTDDEALTEGDLIDEDAGSGDGDAETDEAPEDEPPSGPNL